MSETDEQFQERTNRVFDEINSKKGNLESWVKINDYFFDLREVSAVHLNHNQDNGQVVIKIYLRGNNLEIKTDHVEARKFWEAFTGESLPLRQK